MLLFVFTQTSFSQCEEVVSAAPCPATFKGGDAAIRKWISDSSKYRPVKDREKAIVVFTVDKEGKVSDVSVLMNSNELLKNDLGVGEKEKEAIRLFEASPIWQPAKAGSKCEYNVCERKTMPIFFYPKK